jgi:hypothetical protein
MRHPHFPTASKVYGLFWSTGLGADSSGADTDGTDTDTMIGHGGGDPGVR